MPWRLLSLPHHPFSVKLWRVLFLWWSVLWPASSTGSSVFSHWQFLCPVLQATCINPMYVNIKTKLRSYLFIARILFQGRHRFAFMARPVSAGISILNSMSFNRYFRSAGVKDCTSWRIWTISDPTLATLRCWSSSWVRLRRVLLLARSEPMLDFVTLVSVIGW